MPRRSGPHRRLPPPCSTPRGTEPGGGFRQGPQGGHPSPPPGLSRPRAISTWRARPGATCIREAPAGAALPARLPAAPRPASTSDRRSIPAASSLTASSPSIHLPGLSQRRVVPDPALSSPTRQSGRSAGRGAASRASAGSLFEQPLWPGRPPRCLPDSFSCRYARPGMPRNLRRIMLAIGRRVRAAGRGVLPLQGRVFLFQAGAPDGHAAVRRLFYRRVRRRVRCGPRAGRPCRRAPPVRPVHVTRRQRVRRQAARQAARSNYGAAPRRRGPRVNRADRGRTWRANAPLPIFSCQPRRACAA